jgi:hypothetical protein
MEVILMALGGLVVLALEGIGVIVWLAVTKRL